ncbi:MAG: hypothetical protein ACRDMZ_17785 [Solirubrobacteraceae bacterium]
MERIEGPKGYVLANKQTVEDIIAIEAELLRSEGVNPRWPGFPEAEQEHDEEQ